MLTENKRLRFIDLVPLPDKEFTEIYETHKAILDLRGKCLGFALNIEEMLDQIILDFLFDNSKKREFFDNWIIRTDKLQLMFKVKIFCNLIEEEFFPEPKTNLKQSLHKVVSTRNKFAHGRIEYLSKRSPALVYFEGELKIEPINVENVAKDLSILTDTYFDLLNYIKAMDGKRNNPEVRDGD